MLSPADMLLLGAAALILFGPDQLPKVAKRAGQVVREVQNTSQSFIREMERAADETERRERYAANPVPASPADAHEDEPEIHHEMGMGLHDGPGAPGLDHIEIIQADPAPAPRASAPAAPHATDPVAASPQTYEI